MDIASFLDLQQIRECDGVNTPERAKAALFLIEQVRRRTLSNRNARGAIAAAAGIAAVVASVIGAAGAAYGVCQANCQDKIDIANAQRDTCFFENEDLILKRDTCFLENNELILERDEYKASSNSHKFDAAQLHIQLDECLTSIPHRVAEAELECERKRAEGERKRAEDIAEAVAEAGLECERKRAEDEYVCACAWADYHDTEDDDREHILIGSNRFRRQDGQDEGGEEKSFFVSFFEGLAWCAVAETSRVRGREEFSGADRRAGGGGGGGDGCYRRQGDDAARFPRGLLHDL